MARVEPVSSGVSTPVSGSASDASGATASGAVGSPVAGSLTEHAAPQHYDGYAWLVAWGVMIAILTLVNRTRIGHAAIYYGLLLMLFFIIVSNYRFITTALAPFQSLP